MLVRTKSTASSRIQNYRTSAYVLTILVYLIFGAAVFDKLESTKELERSTDIKARINLFRERHNISVDDFNNLTVTVEQIILYRKKHWKFPNSFYYATVVLALIGYGHSVPITIPGRAVTIAYALIGIPMWLIMIQSVGERLNALLKFVLKHVKRKLQRRREPKITSMQLLTCEAILTVLTITTAAYVFHRTEGWLYFDALYYCLLTLATIGLGDLVPMQRPIDAKNPVSWPYGLFCILFIFTGLTIVASSGNLLILRFVEANSKRSQHERHEMEERHRHHVRLIGDVISSNGRLITLEDDENTPSLSVPIASQHMTMGNSSSDSSLCSCQTQPSLTLCIPTSCKRKFERQQRTRCKQSMIKSQKISKRTLDQEILHSLGTKNEMSDGIILDKRHSHRDQIHQRSSI